MAEKLRDHKDLDVWKKSMELVEMIYTWTKEFPQEELYGLSSQMRRAAVSIPSNIAEGAARKNPKEFVQFLYIALGSLAEVETQLLISQKLGYVKEEIAFDEIILAIKHMLNGLIKYLRNR